MNHSECTYQLPSGFKTSIKALKEVMGIPLRIIQNELRKNNYPIESSGNCIDEKMLERFEYLYRKRLKKYFVSSVENFDNLTREEYADFVEFSKAFSKDGELTLNWKKIDKSAIRESFFSQILEATSNKIVFKISKDFERSMLRFLESLICRRDESLPVLDAKDILNCSLSNLQSPYTNYDVDDCNLHETRAKLLQRRTRILRKVTHSRLYRCKVRKIKIPHWTILPTIVRVYTCHRLYIVPDDGNSDGDESCLRA